MKYFNFSIIFIILMLVFIWLTIKASLLKRFYRSFILCKTVYYHSTINNDAIFSSYIILKVADLIYDANCKIQECLLDAISINNYDKVIEYIKERDVVLSYAYAAHFDFKKIKNNLQKHVKNNKENVLAFIVLALIYSHEFKYDKLRLVLNKLRNCKINTVEKAILLSLEAKIDMYDADMLSASQKAMNAVKLFKKHNLFYEEANGYMILGEIYRISAVFDVSQMMFETAEKIYSSLNAIVLGAEIKALKAMLFISNERFQEAAFLLQESKKIFKKNKLYRKEAEIINQQSLINILQKKYTNALKLAQKALIIHQDNKNIRGMAFSYELMSLSQFSKKNYEKTFEYAQSAMNYYLKSKNYSAFEDAAFLAAQATFYLEQYSKSEQICRNIIDVFEKYCTCFHIANVYSLLGLIYIKLNDLSRAKSLFKKSLSLEQCNQRFSAAATDYMNLALIEEKSGHNNMASEILQVALENAFKQQDEQLCAIIKAQIKKIKKF